MPFNERITIDPQICHGKPCIRGLRYPVENILELLSAGMEIEEILADYEDLEKEDILAVLARDCLIDRKSEHIERKNHYENRHYTRSQNSSSRAYQFS